MLFYCGTLLAVHIIILHTNLNVLCMYIHPFPRERDIHLYLWYILIAFASFKDIFEVCFYAHLNIFLDLE